ncbi:MAG: lipocalin-like domain-containing protein [Candidatus Caenarcaniphilales bacterium]|nr:lipocalin-like domain-containing protein [Candidatus Caenarcaniphilales bacterium]
MTHKIWILPKNQPKAWKIVGICLGLLFLSSLLKVTADGFLSAKKGYQYNFPFDHGAHPQFATEWWYYTGNLEAIDGDDRFGFQLTFFRIGVSPQESIYAAHFALSDIDGKRFAYFDRINRPQQNIAGVAQDANGTAIWNKNWSSRISADGKSHLLTAQEGGVSINLNLAPSFKPVIQGVPGEGISRKGDCENCASHYYSYPSMMVNGTLSILGRTIPVAGTSWMDHEFGSNHPNHNQVGWDWFSMHLDHGDSLMLYRIRQADGSISPFSNGTYISSKGKQTYLSKGDFNLIPRKTWKSPKSGAIYPLTWEITVPRLNLGLKVYPELVNQELDTSKSTRAKYWEGAIRVIDRAKAKEVGQGYLELTGYADGASL